MPPVTNSSDLDDTADDISDFGSVPRSLNVNENMPDLQHFCASYTLALEAKHNLSQSTVNDVLTATGSLVEHHLHNYASKVKDKLAELGIDTSVVDDIPFDSFLDSLNSSSKRCDYYKRHLSYREPVAVKLGTNKVVRKGVEVDLPQFGYIIPFRDSIRYVFELKEVYREIYSPHVSNNDYMYDFCDGNYIKSHPLFNRNPAALQIILNTDDLEIANPLGSHTKKHKVTMFYFTLANIRPAFRSQLHAIQLLAIAKTTAVRRFGESKLLEDFVNTVNELSSGGLQMHVNGILHVVEGALVCVSADTLASHWIGKFKEGVAFAMRACRHFECRGTETRLVFSSSDCRLRSLSEHKERCQMLSQLSVKSRVYWSKMWGINGESCLLKLHDFPLIQGLVQDPMHILLEGVVPHDMSLLLYKVVFVAKLCTEKELNLLITGFPYSYLHVHSIPEPLDKGSIESVISVKQTASAMLTLCQILPVILGPMIPDDHEIVPFWQNFLRLLNIVIISTSTYCSHDTPSWLRVTISKYLQEFQRLYPRASFIPKLHYLVHLPDQMAEYGPLRNQWCMRFEGENGFFKYKKWRNFRNIPYSLAKYHQMYMTYKRSCLSFGTNENFLYAGDLVANGHEADFKQLFPDLVYDLKIMTGVESSNVYLTPSVTIHGCEYRPGCALIVKYEYNGTPEFGVVKQIFVVHMQKYFVVECMNAELDEHTMYYVFLSSGRQRLYSFYSLPFSWPLSVYHYSGRDAVLNTCSHTCPLF